MEIFDAEWLALREAADRRARDGTLPERLSAAWRRRGWSRVVDLGSGTGANLRYLAPRLPSGQRWTLVDHDPRHVDRLQRLEVPPEVDAVAAVSRDLAADGLAVVEGADLVTASALLDLVSESWLEELVNRCVDTACGAYFALTVDGRVQWMTESAAGWRVDGDPDDGFVWSVFNRHQRIDKGFGPALGPTAAVSAARLFHEAGVPHLACLERLAARCRRPPAGRPARRRMGGSGGRSPTGTRGSGRGLGLAPLGCAVSRVFPRDGRAPRSPRAAG